ncbi:3-oxoadipyl-CoA thiolase [Brevundimonas diminuta]|uniref:3-oxoadipyl-CoA thiolase n=1 Tax=Brevundimonas diminuta TaxID=293 RepID=UPI003D9A77E7
MTDAFICDAARTPIGKFAGSLAHVRTDDLAAAPLKALIERNEVDPAAIDEVFYGCANQAGEDNRDVARMASLLAGLPVSVPGVTLNRLCASGADAVGAAARAIKTGEAELTVAGGVESMTRAPLVQAKATTAFQRGAQIEDTVVGWRFVNPKIRQLHGVASMPETGENVADRYKVTREDQDRFGLWSQNKAAAAKAFHAGEIVPVEARDAKGKPFVFDADEYPRETSLELLAKLKPVVRPDGTVTAGNASGINDGAAALFIASKDAAASQGLTPRAKILGFASAGVEPDIMGVGPIYSTRKLLDRLNLTMADFDVIEFNEAFASQVIASMRELGVDPFDDRINPHGGGIALGHPLGMTGARLSLTAAHALEKRGGRLALITMCVGVGQGVSIVIERA